FDVEKNPTNQPSPEIDAVCDGLVPWVSSLLTETSSVVPSRRSRTNTSPAPLRSSGTRLDADDRKATNRPSAEIEGPSDSEVAWTPPAPTEIRSVVTAWRSRTNTSATPFVSTPTRLLALDTNATKRPSADRAGSVA